MRLAAHRDRISMHSMQRCTQPLLRKVGPGLSFHTAALPYRWECQEPIRYLLLMPAAHFVAADACMGAFTALCAGAQGLRFCLAEAQSLQDRTEQELLLCRPWMLSSAYEIYRRAFTGNRHSSGI